MIYDGNGSVKMMESAKSIKSTPKKESYWAGVKRRFKMDWEYSKSNILGSLTGSVIFVIIVLLLIRSVFEEAFLESLIFILSAFFFFIASGFAFRYMIPEKSAILIVEDKNIQKKLAQLEEQMVNEIQLKSIVNPRINR